MALHLKLPLSPNGTTINTLIRAIDNQSYGSYDRKFARWERDYGESYGTNLLLQEQESGSCTYTVKFAKVFNITCQNDFEGSRGGIINVEGTARDDGWIEPVVSNINSQEGQVTLQAIDNQVIYGAEYTFDHWSNGSTSNPCTFTVASHQTITAVFKEELSVSLSGPSFLNSMVSGTFTANPSGGSDTYTNYRWWERKDKEMIPRKTDIKILAPPSGYWIRQTGWEGQQSVHVARSYNFSLKCEVTDSDNDIAADIHSVTVFGGFRKTSSEDIQISLESAPESFVLIGNYPNPFNPSTTIKFGLPEDTNINFSIYSVTGQKIASLADGFYLKGYHELKWNGKNQAGNAVSNGIYIYELIAGSQRLIKKMVFVK